jgi:4'-phosphopantetheinyl transferase
MSPDVSAVGRLLGSVATAGSEAELWLAWVGDHPADVDRFSRDFLSNAERDHLTGYRSRAAAERYVVTRSLVRVVLGRRLGIEPPRLLVNRTDTGKPVLTEGIHFNVSHSGDLILLAVSEARAVGVDVERRRAVERVNALVERWLNAVERREFDNLCEAGSSASDAFLRVWSLKEARLKALGVGIAGAATAAMAPVDVRPLDDLLDRLSGQHVGNGYVGAVAFA